MTSSVEALREQLSHEDWKARQNEITRTILEEPHIYFKRGFTIGEYSLINSYEMLRKDVLCFEKAWLPYEIKNDEDRQNINTLRIHLCGMIRFASYYKLEENVIYKIIDAYPFVLEEDDAYFKIRDDLLQRYRVYKERIAAFPQTEFALSLPGELVALILSKC